MKEFIAPIVTTVAAAVILYAMTNIVETNKLASSNAERYKEMEKRFEDTNVTMREQGLSVAALSAQVQDMKDYLNREFPGWKREKK
jgi:hypothetical protein